MAEVPSLASIPQNTKTIIKKDTFTSMFITNLVLQQSEYENNPNIQQHIRIWKSCGIYTQ